MRERLRLAPPCTECSPKGGPSGRSSSAADKCGTGFTTLALVSDDELSRIVRDISKELQKVEPESLRKQLPAILEDSLEYAAQPAPPACLGGAPGNARHAEGGREDAHLDQSL